jgi:ferredoxin, 2Fe-2S
MITFEVEDSSGKRRTIEVPEEINLSLMEVLRASDYPVEATCGGMALCATCYVEVLYGIEQLGARTEPELDMLDTLPNANDKSRLACQIKIDERMQNVLLRIKTEAK